MGIPSLSGIVAARLWDFFATRLGTLDVRQVVAATELDAPALHAPPNKLLEHPWPHRGVGDVLAF